MAERLAFELVGDWTSPRLLLRMISLGGSPWEPLRTGYTHRDTGERVTLAMGPPQPALADAFAAGVDPARPTLDEALLDEVLRHRAVVVVSDPVAPDDAPLARPRTLLRAAGQIVNGGALAARCRTSGLAHGADGLHALVLRLEEAGEAELGPVLLQAYVRFDLGSPAPRTFGMHALGLPDVQLSEGGTPDRVRARLEAEALSLLSGAPAGTLRPDPGDPADPTFNPLGLSAGRRA